MLRISLFLISTCLAQFLLSQSARSLSMGNASSSFTDQWSALHNAAGLAWEEGTFVSSGIVNHYFLRELTGRGVLFSHSAKGKAASLTFRRIGDERLHIDDITMSYSQKFGEILSLSLSLSGKQFAFSDVYGNKILFYPAFGLISKPGRSSFFSFHFTNPGREFISRDQNERLESLFAFAYRHDFSNKFQLHTEIEKVTASEPSIKAAMVYKALDIVSIRFGIEGLYRRFGFGLTLYPGQFETEIAFSYQHGPGFITGIGLSYQITPKK